MSSKKQVLSYFKFLDDLSNKLISIEPYWSKCSPCKNQGNCCKNSKTLVTRTEWSLIKQYIFDNLKENLKLIKFNVDNNSNCPFWSEECCLIYDVRPVVCRMTPYLSRLEGDKIVYSITSDDCLFSGSVYIGCPDNNDFLKSNIIKLPVNKPGDPRQAAYYLTTINLDKNQTHQELSNEEQKNVVDWLKDWSYLNKTKP
jgi:Fe-S-cluster containining protein